MSVSEIKRLIEELGAHPNKKLGQHYLIDKAVANRQVQYANISNNDTVLEIGPGLGVLTRILAERAKKVIAIEMDEVTAAYLERELPIADIICADALEVGLPAFDKVVSNLPFNISSSITFKLLEQDFETGILMYQEEFARRLAAREKSSDYSRLSVTAYYRARCEALETVPRTSFYPQPRVDSSIVRIVPRPPPFTVENEDHFLGLTKALFNHRRKQIGNSLMLEWRTLCGSKELMRSIVSRLPDSKIRVEDMSPEEIGKLSNWIFEEKLNLGKGNHS